MNNEIRIVIADDHPVFSHGLRHTIEADARFRVIGEAGDGEAALAQIRGLKPAIAILDVHMPKLDGLAVARAIRRDKLPVELIFLTIHNEEDFFCAAMDLGVKGYLLKDSAMPDIVKAVISVAEGSYYVTPSLTNYLLERRKRAQAFAQKQPGLEDLTPTERRILCLVAQGKSSKSIAEELFVHYRTIDNHRAALCQKLGLRGHIALVKFAFEHKSEL